MSLFRSIKAVSLGVKLQQDQINIMHQKHPQGIFSRAIKANSNIKAKLVDTNNNSKQTPSTPYTSNDLVENKFSQTSENTKTEDPSYPQTTYSELPSRLDIDQIDLFEYNSKTNENITIFHQKYKNYIFHEKGIVGEKKIKAFNQMLIEGKKATNFKLSGRGGVVDGRQFVEVVLENNYSFLMYRSTGTGTSTKTEGEWVPFPGWNENDNNSLFFIEHQPLQGGGDLKFTKYNISMFQEVDQFLKDNEQKLFPELQKNTNSTNNSRETSTSISDDSILDKKEVTENDQIKDPHEDKLKFKQHSSIKKTPPPVKPKPKKIQPVAPNYEKTPPPIKPKPKKTPLPVASNYKKTPPPIKPKPNRANLATQNAKNTSAPELKQNTNSIPNNKEATVTTNNLIQDINKYDFSFLDDFPVNKAEKTQSGVQKQHLKEWFDAYSDTFSAHASPAVAECYQSILVKEQKLLSSEELIKRGIINFETTEAFERSNKKFNIDFVKQLLKDADIEPYDLKVSPPENQHDTSFYWKLEKQGKALSFTERADYYNKINDFSKKHGIPKELIHLTLDEFRDKNKRMDTVIHNTYKEWQQKNIGIPVTDAEHDKVFENLINIKKKVMQFDSKMTNELRFSPKEVLWEYGDMVILKGKPLESRLNNKQQQNGFNLLTEVFGLQTLENGGEPYNLDLHEDDVIILVPRSIKGHSLEGLRDSLKYKNMFFYDELPDEYLEKLKVPEYLRS